MCIIIMLGGVAFFSYIMGNFIEILSNYETKMGIVDKNPFLQQWLISLQRFTNNTPLKLSLVEEIWKDLNYYWAHDRLLAFESQDKYFSLIPDSIKYTILTNYSFKDIFKSHPNFFTPTVQSNQSFLFDFAMGMMPRKFDASDKQDRIIYEEDQDVAEMYFVFEGFLGIAINQFPEKLTKSFYKLGKKQKGKSIICDHYVINKRRSRFIYIAL